MEDDAYEKAAPVRETQDLNVTVYELEKMPDGILRIGNSIEVPVSEAVMLIDQKKAKHPDHPIGVVPGEWT